MRSGLLETSYYATLALSSEETRPSGPPADHADEPRPPLAVRISGLGGSKKAALRK